VAPLRVAVAGAGGIGRHHARWHALVGSKVVAFLGRRPEALETTAGQLRDLFGFSGRGYVDFDELLATEKPDIVDVSAADEAHYDLTARALDAGCHVLCEKPLVWADSPAAAVAQGRQLVEQARAAGRHLGLCSQYAASLPQYRRLAASADPDGATAFESTMETLSKGRGRSAREVWIDMGPHPLSLVLAAWPDAEFDADSLQARFDGCRAEVSGHVRAGGQQRQVRIVVADREEGPLERCFAFDGERVDLTGRPGEDGVYRSVMVRDGVEDEAEDFMHLLIAQFTRAAAGDEPEPLVPGELAVRNLELLAAPLTH
jgi:predicted dehydrogenase